MQEETTHTYYTLSCAYQPEQQKIFCKKYSTVKNECQNHTKLNKKGRCDEQPKQKKFW